MSIKKTQLEITIEQKQTWRISQSDREDFFNNRQTDKRALLKDTLSMEISPREIQSQGWVFRILSVFVRAVNRLLHHLL